MFKSKWRYNIERQLTILESRTGANYSYLQLQGDELRKLEQRFGNIGSRLPFAALEQRFGNIEKRLRSLEGQMDARGAQAKPRLTPKRRVYGKSKARAGGVDR